ncbi:MAG: very short patch repair endonuclease [Flavobacteriales bacterium]|nr:very short patch repair endonuclease [Flavobacteriales bacterium]
MASATYIRDGRAPIPASEQVSRVMSRIRSRDTAPERIMRRALWVAGLRGYRLHYKKVPGRPDIAFVSRKLAVFVHGCFWHGCPYCQPRRPRTHEDFWNMKLARNQARDARKSRELRKAGWRVLAIWECQLKRDPERQVQRVLRAWHVSGRTAAQKSAFRTPRKKRTARTVPRRSGE